MAHCLRQRLTALSRRRSISTSTASGGGARAPILLNPLDTNVEDGTATIQLLSWGKGYSGQLGDGTEKCRHHPTAVANLILNPSSFDLSPTSGRLANPNDVMVADPGTASVGSSDQSRRRVNVGISCGLFHSSLLVDGKIWIWGKGDGGRLGLGHEDSILVPTLNPNVDSVGCLALGGLHSVGLTHQGQVFTWGYGGFGALGHSVYHRELLPRLVRGPWDQKICQIATSGTHTAAITESGDIYTWGRDQGDGRLGLGPGPGPNEGGGYSIPTKVKALPVPAAAVTCGGFFTLVLTEEGQVWNWGANSNFELGRGNKVGGWRPNPVPSLQDVRIIQVAGGGYHSLALSDEGRVFSWGHGGHGQLGHSSIKSEKVPTVIEALADERIIHIACGASTSAAITDEGKLYMWGNSKDSQLGAPGLPEFQPSPVEVNFLTDDDRLGPCNVLSVAVGSSHAMCLVSRSSS